MKRIGAGLMISLTFIAGILVMHSQGTADSHVSSREARQPNPFPANDKNIAAGKAVYQKHCIDCHGPSGKGDGRIASDLDPRPRDLSSPRIVRQTDGALFWKITRGEKPMPEFSKLASDEERWLVVLYVRTFAPPQQEGADTR